MMRSGDTLRFFFSSRRRHTRLQGDWSSDVCSSDLGYLEYLELYAYFARTGERKLSQADYEAADAEWRDLGSRKAQLEPVRSEERRVGTEGRRWARGGTQRTRQRLRPQCCRRDRRGG